MTTQDPPLSRPLKVDDVPAEGLTATIEANAEERDALAAAFGLLAVHSLVGSFEVKGSPRQLSVEGRVEARVRQRCVVTLDPFDADVDEGVAVTFAESPISVAAWSKGGSGKVGRSEPPDEIVDGEIDLGALTAEFLSLGLDPYPKKPGVTFAHKSQEQAAVSPFAGLADLKAKLPRGE